jgi:hypothetical protein
MKTALALFVVATVLVTSSLSAIQSGSEPENPVVRPGIQESDGEFTPEVQRYISRGDERITHLRFAAAAREYRRAADVARREGHLPSGTTWMVASACFNGNDLLGAAAALDQLANEAALIGDLGVEALAIYNSAWLYGKAGRGIEMTARVTRLKGLLRSRYMPIGIREQLLGRLDQPSKVAAF